MSSRTLKIRQQDGSLQHTDLQVALADTFYTRLVGLLAHRSLDDQSGLLIVPCGSIHTMGMRFSIDVVYLDRNGKVLGYSDHVKPNRFRFAPRGTHAVLEVAEGNRKRTGIHLDGYLIFD